MRREAAAVEETHTTALYKVNNCGILRIDSWRIPIIFLPVFFSILIFNSEREKNKQEEEEDKEKKTGRWG